MCNQTTELENQLLERSSLLLGKQTERAKLVNKTLAAAPYSIDLDAPCLEQEIFHLMTELACEKKSETNLLP